MKFSKGQSRNTHDWSQSKSNGRIVITATGGVEKRIGYLVERLSSHPKQTHAQLLTHLQSKHRSYSENDLTHALARMVENGFARCTTKGRLGLYSLTANGKARWNSTPTEWV